MNPNTIWIMGQIVAVVVVAWNLGFWRDIWRRNPTSTPAWDHFRTDFIRFVYSILGLVIGLLSFWVVVDRYGWHEAMAFTLDPHPSGPVPFSWQRSVIIWGLVLYGLEVAVVSALSRHLWNQVGGEFPHATTDEITAIAEKTAAELKIVTGEQAEVIRLAFEEAIAGIGVKVDESKRAAQEAYHEANDINRKIAELNARLLAEEEKKGT